MENLYILFLLILTVCFTSLSNMLFTNLRGIYMRSYSYKSDNVRTSFHRYNRIGLIKGIASSRSPRHLRRRIRHYELNADAIMPDTSLSE